MSEALESVGDSEEIEPMIEPIEKDPGDPGDLPTYDSPILKIRGKSNPQGYGSGGKFKKSK